ncbi:MAG: hypothetical protein ACXABY_04870 [Candidatus Thorarchaeota archaeon]
MAITLDYIYILNVAIEFTADKGLVDQYRVARAKQQWRLKRLNRRIDPYDYQERMDFHYHMVSDITRHEQEGG